MGMICLSHIARRSFIFLEEIPNGAEYAGFVHTDVYHASRLSATLKQIHFHWSRIHGILDGDNGVTLANRMHADLHILDGDNGVSLASRIHADLHILDGDNGVTLASRIHADLQILDGNNGVTLANRMHADLQILDGDNGVTLANRMHADLQILDGDNGVTLASRIHVDLQELCIFTNSGLVHVDEIFGHVLKIPKVPHHLFHFIIRSVSFSPLNYCGPL